MSSNDAPKNPPPTQGGTAPDAEDAAGRPAGAPRSPLAPTLIAWGVHAITASGAALGTFALFAVASGRFEVACLLMLTTLFIDGVDGTLARAARVAEHTPQIDGRRLDDIVDYLNFVIVPVFFMWGAGAVSQPAWLAAPVLASAYGFSREDAKTADDFFLGFPSYWNILAIYLWLLGVGPTGGTLWVAGLSIGVFVPMKYLYPSKVQPMGLRVALGVGAIVWTALVAACALRAETLAAYHAVEISLAYPAWYMWLSITRGGFDRTHG